MTSEPAIKRTVAFFDGQNLFHAAREAFGCKYPDYSPLALATRICEQRGWSLHEIRFYTGIPDPKSKPFWHHFWIAKMGAMGHQGIVTFCRRLRYRNQAEYLPDGTLHTFLVSEEKGIDVRIALDVIRLAREKALDVALIFSQDQDFSEVADEIKSLSSVQGRWIKIASAFPVSPTARNRDRAA